MSNHPIDYSKLRKDPTSGLMFGPLTSKARSYTYSPITVTAEEISRASAESERFRAANEDAIARMVEHLAMPMVFIRDVDVKITGIGTIKITADPALDPNVFKIESGGRTTHVVGVDYGLEPDPADPLDVEYDGVALRHLLALDENQRRESNKHGRTLSRAVYTPAQRAAVSAHWSAELRAKVAASKERECNAVAYCEVDADD